MRQLGGEAEFLGDRQQVESLSAHPDSYAKAQVSGPIVVDDIDASVDITSGTVNDDPTDINVSSQACVTPSDYLWLNGYALAEATWTSGDGVTSTAPSAAYGAIAMR